VRVLPGLIVMPGGYDASRSSAPARTKRCRLKRHHASVRDKGEAVSAAAGVICLGKAGEPVTKGQPVVELHGDAPSRLDAARAELAGAIDVGDEPPPASPLILQRIGF